MISSNFLYSSKWISLFLFYMIIWMIPCMVGSFHVSYCNIQQHSNLYKGATNIDFPNQIKKSLQSRDINHHHHHHHQRIVKIMMMSSPRNSKISKIQKIKKILKFPLKVFSEVTNVIKISTYTIIDGTNIIISNSIRNNEMNDNDDIQTIPKSVLRYTQDGVDDDEFKETTNVLEKIGNITLTTRQTLKAANPINIIGNGLKGIQNIVNVVYDMQDTIEEMKLRKEQAELLGMIH